SAGHRYSNVNLDDPNFEKTPFEPFDSYGRSKTANILFAVEFDRRHRDRAVRAAAVHPGIIETELARHMDRSWLEKRAYDINQHRAGGGKDHLQRKSVQQGAATSVWAGLVAPLDEIGGRYCEDCHVGAIIPDDIPVSSMTEGVRAYAVNL